MHEGLTFNNWFVWLLWAFFAAVLIGAVAVLVSALRRPDADFGAFGRTPWLVVQTLLLAVSGFVLVAGAFDVLVEPGAMGYSAIGLLVIVAVIQQFAYLLRVVFPSPKRLASRAAAQQRSGQPS